MWAYFVLRAGWLKINVGTNLGQQIFTYLSALEQVTKAMFSLLKKWRKFEIPVDLMLELFDKSVVPILSYGYEAWGLRT